jgi:thiol-disulfide isomerase/thioredoxin
MKKGFWIIGILLWGLYLAGASAASSEPELWTKITTLFAPYDKDMLMGNDNFKKDAPVILPLAREYQKDFPQGPHSIKNKNILGWALGVTCGRAKGVEKTSLLKEVDELSKDTSLDALAQVWLFIAKQNSYSIEEQEKIARDLFYRFPDKKVSVVPYFFIGKNYEEQGNMKKAISIYTECTATPDGYFRKTAINSLQREEVPLNKPVYFEFTDLDGKKIDTREMKGKIIIVDYWATWCGPCVGEIDGLKKIYDHWHDKGVEIIGINLDDEKKDLVKFLKEKNITWAQDFEGLGWGNKFATRYGINAIPEVWLIDQNGILVSTDNRNGLEQKLHSMLHGKGPLTFSQRTDLYLDYFSSKEEYDTALKEYQAVSQLTAGEALKYIPVKYEKGRIAQIFDSKEYLYYYGNLDYYDQVIMPTALFKYSPPKNQYNKFGMSAHLFQLKNLLYQKGYRDYEIDGDKKILETVMAGDYVINTKASGADYFRDLMKICKEQFNLPIKITVKYEPRKVWVASGTYQYKPIFKDQKKDFIYITDNERYVDNNADFYPRKEPFTEMLDLSFSRYIDARDFIETDDGKIPQVKCKHFGISIPPDTNQLVDHVSQQTGLSFSYQVRNMPVVHVEMEAQK